MITPAAGASQWNTLLVEGKRSPGVVRLSGNDLKINWDIKAAAGLIGATTTRLGELVKEFDAEFELSDEDDDAGLNDFDAWDEFQRLLESSIAGKKARAMEVHHPDLARNHITAVTLGLISGMVVDGKGGGKIKVHFLEYKPPKPNRPINSVKTAGDKMIDDATKKLQQVQDDFNKPPKPIVVGDKL